MSISQSGPVLTSAFWKLLYVHHLKVACVLRALSEKI